jgi:beta-galactosidase/beta-glucuronidase
MEQTRLARTEREAGEAKCRSGRGPAPVVTPGARVTVDGKALSRDGRRLRVRGVTYGPFPANAAGEPFPDPARVRSDFTDMRDIRVNAIRTYHLPPVWLLRLADERGLGVFVDVPWPKHLCFLDGAAAAADARRAVRRAATRCRSHPGVLAYSIGNEIPPNVVRWHGNQRV